MLLQRTDQCFDRLTRDCHALDLARAAGGGAFRRGIRRVSSAGAEPTTENASSPEHVSRRRHLARGGGAPHTRTR